MITDRTAALRVLVRRGGARVDIVAEDDEIAGKVSMRFSRGNISMQRNRIQTEEDLDQARAALRAKLQKKQ